MNSSVIDLSKASERREIVPQSEAASLILALERAARDPAVDVVKLRELLAMRKEIAHELGETEFNTAMNACQQEMTRIAADATNPQTKSKYVSYAQLDRALRPIYTKHGMAISFDEADCPRPEFVRVLAYVTRGGYTRTYRADMPADGKGAKGGDVMTKTHAVGAAKSYGKRYLLKDIFNIAIGEEDRDGNDTEPTITEQQAADLKALITERGGNMGKLLNYFKIRSLSEILAKNYDWAVSEVKRLAQAAAEARAPR